MSELYWSIEVHGDTEEEIRLDAHQKLEKFLGHSIAPQLIELDVDGHMFTDGTVAFYRGTARYRRDA